MLGALEIAVVLLLLCFFGPPAQSGRHENWKLSKIIIINF